ncbi:MAG: flagellar basal body-associated FliL family protein [Clostridiales bacterium]|nr:flagellar basal body-associated FliL family protein [Clostridiales bacterium]
MEKNNTLMIVIIVLLVILLGSVGAVSFYAFKVFGNAQEPPPASAEAPPSKLSVEDIEKVNLSSPISTNLKVGTDGMDHYVKINLSIGVNKTDKKESPKMIEMLGANEMVTRDIVLNILRSKAIEDLDKPEGQELMKNAIREALQLEFESTLIVQVYISDLAFYFA